MGAAAGAKRERSKNEGRERSAQHDAAGNTKAGPLTARAACSASCAEGEAPAARPGRRLASSPQRLAEVRLGRVDSPLSRRVYAAQFSGRRRPG
jgi:hypothetical protein